MGITNRISIKHPWIIHWLRSALETMQQCCLVLLYLAHKTLCRGLKVLISKSMHLMAVGWLSAFSVGSISILSASSWWKEQKHCKCVLHVILMRRDWFALKHCQFWSLLSSDPQQDHFHKEALGHQLQKPFPHVISHGFVLGRSFRLKDTSAHWPQGLRVDHCLIHDYHPPVKQDKTVTATPFNHTYITA